MSNLTVRRFALDAQGWTSTTTTLRQVHIAQAILLNATAALRPRPLDFGTYTGEVRLLLSGLHLRRNQPLRMRSSMRRASSHVQRFVTEGAALAATTSLAEPYGWSLRCGLPVHVDLAFSWSGARPDLLFPVGNNQRIAGESRGRRVTAAAASLHKAQSDRLTELQTWETGPHGSQWFMAWSWFTAAETVVDYFDPGRPRRAERSLAVVASDLADELWTTAPSSQRELLGQPVRGSLIDADMFVEHDDGTIQAYIGVFREDTPATARGAFRPDQGEVEVAVSSRLIVVAHSGGGMDFADIAGTVSQLG